MLPKTMSPKERVRVRLQADSGQPVVEPLGVPATHDDLVSLKRRFESHHDVDNMAPPLLLPESLPSRIADVLLAGASLPIRKARKLHRFQHHIDESARSPDRYPS
jgi:hypothetical protein